MNIEFKTGNQYVVDIKTEKMLYGVLYRASINSGYITEIKLPEDKKNCHFFSYKDLSNNKVDINGTTINILAEEKISYYGEPILFVVGENIDTINSVIKNIYVSYSIFDGYNSIFLSVLGKKSLVNKTLKIGKSKDDDNLYNLFHSYYTQSQEHFYPDCQGVVIQYIDKNSIKVDISSDWPKHVKETIKNLLNIKNVEVTKTKTSPTYDGKIWQPTILAVLAANAAINLKVDIKVYLSKYEDILFSIKRASSIYFIESKINRANKLEKLKISFDYNCGASTPFAKELLETAIFATSNFYKSNLIEIFGQVIRSANTPSDFLSGISMPQYFFAMENNINKISSDLKILPTTFRMENINHKFFETQNELIEKYRYFEIQNFTKSRFSLPKDYQDSPFKAILYLINRVTDFERKYSAFELQRSKKNRSIKLGHKKGIGLATAFQANNYNSKNSAFNYFVKLEYSTSKNLKITTSSISDSKNIIDHWKNVASEILDIKPENIQISYSFNKNLPEASPSIMSSNISTITKLIREASKDIVNEKNIDGDKKIIEVIKTGADILPENKKDLLYTTSSCAAIVVEVSVENITNEIKIDKINIVLDSGKILDKKIARQRLEVALIQSIVWATVNQSNSALAKEFIFNFPGIQYMPKITIDFMESNNQDAKGLSEIAYSLFPAAFTSAVSQATNKNIRAIPVIQENLTHIIEEKNDN